MKSLRKSNKTFRTATSFLCLYLIATQLFWGTPFSALAQTVIRRPKRDSSEAPSGMPPGFPGMPSSGGPSSSSSDSSSPGLPLPADPPEPAPSGTNSVSGKGTNAAPDEIEVSFQGANIEMIVQWLAQTSGKSVVKHPRAQCQLTIVSSKKVSKREAINLVYGALALEGFSAIETGKRIYIVPEGSEPKMSPELLDASRTDIPAGRQKLVKIFQLKYVQAGDLKDKLTGALSDKGTVSTDDRANQIIVSDYNDNLRLAEQIIKVLDTDKPGDVTVRIIALKNVAAEDLVKDVGPLYQKMNAKSPGEIIEISANERANSLIVLSSKSNYEGIEKLVTALDTEDAQEKVMQAFPLKNADAQDVAKQLKDLMADQDSSSGNRYPFFFMSQSGSSKGGKKASFVADRRRNTIVVQAPPGAMESIGKMIAELDEPVADDSIAPVIYPLKYVNAADIEDVLNELFLKKTQQQRPYWWDDNQDPSYDKDVGRLYGKVRITSEPYSNAIIITSNSKENLMAVEDVLKQLDQPSEAGESTFRLGLKFADASTVANSINILFAKGGSPPLRPVAQNTQQNGTQQQNQQTGQTDQQGSSISSTFDLSQDAKQDGYYPWLGGQPENTRTSDGRTTARPVSDLVGKVRVVPDPRSNSLLISANVHFFPQVLKLIEELDAPTAQVMIEAKIVEVSSDFLDQLGVRWSPNGSTFTAADYDNSLIATSTGSYGTGFGGTTRGNSTSQQTVATQSGGGVPTINTTTLVNTLTGLRTGTLNNTISLDFLVQFLHETTHATVLGSPQMNVRDNEMGKLFVGQQVPFINQSQNYVGSLTQSFAYKPVGVILEVTPHINSSGDVELKIHAESSSIVPGQTLFGGAIIDTRYFKTDLEAKDGQTLVLGGIIQKQVSDTLRKTPIVGDIPGIKWLFNKKDTTTQEVELIVFLRPRVVRNPLEAKELSDDVTKQAPLVKKWLEDNAKQGKGKKDK